MKEVEYRVRPVTRYVVTRWCAESHGKMGSVGSKALGEFENEAQALTVMQSLAAYEASKNPLPAVPFGEDGMSVRWTEDADAQSKA